MTNERILTIVVTVLGAGFLLCLGGVLWLSAQPETRPIPDVLVGAVTGILGLLGGLLIPSPTRARNQRGHIDPVAAAVVGFFVVVTVLLLVKFA